MTWDEIVRVKRFRVNDAGPVQHPHLKRGKIWEDLALPLIPPSSSRVSPVQDPPTTGEPSSKETSLELAEDSIGILLQNPMRTSVIAWREKGKEKQSDIEKKKEKGKSVDLAPPFTKKRKIVEEGSPASIVGATETPEELDIEK